jgi:Arc/MetJ-type ribon-helix-helix transcriptional regulator
MWARKMSMAVELPQRLREQVRALVDQGWFSTEEELVHEAVRRFVESHRPELTTRYVLDDVEWGLSGDD